MSELRIFTVDELKAILAKHLAWSNNEKGGECANLRSADLRYADLSYANLHGADLHGADLRYANLRSANLHGADLRYANLRSANLHGADLRYADLHGANLLLIGQDIRGYLFYGFKNDADVLVIRAGCRQFVGITAARAHWTERHIEDAVLHEDCLSLVDRAERMAKARGWRIEADTEGSARANGGVSL